ncbi:RNA-binding protein 39-like isoform X3 [Tachypleus tridentatus]|uniref:RNA-binding protein 39-like isoform X3 n=1 Tax=Tachypleus tridentatus TaxID=6853 RepID=UPI003FD4BE91
MDTEGGDKEMDEVDVDVEAMLEAPYQKTQCSTTSEGSVSDKENKRCHCSRSRSSKRRQKSRSHSRSRRSHRSGSRNRRSRSKERSNHESRSRERSSHESRSRERSNHESRSRERSNHVSRSRERSNHVSRNRERSNYESRSRENCFHRNSSKERQSRSHSRNSHYRCRSRSHDKKQRRGRSYSREQRRSGGVPSPPLSPRQPSCDRSFEMSAEERDMRTVLCMQLSPRIHSQDLEEFFSSVGKVRDVKIIVDTRTRRSKGIAYVEFEDIESVSLAVGLNGQKLLGIPVNVQPSQAEKNRQAALASNLQKGGNGPMRLYVGSLHFNITEDMLKGIFEPFGRIEKVELIRDTETGRSKGYGFITFYNSEDARKALDQLNGFELAGRSIKVGNVTDRSDYVYGASFLDSDELDHTGVGLGVTGRLQLMAKLAEGTGFEIPKVAMSALQMQGSIIQQNSVPPIATQCFMLSNMFDPALEKSPTWDQEIRNDVIEECQKHGGVLHVFVDKASAQGNVFVKCPTTAAAVASVNSLHGRWFAGRIITAAYVPLTNYHNLFADAVNVSPSLTAEKCLERFELNYH